MLRRLAILAALASLLVGAPWAAGVGTPPPVDAAAYIVIDPATGETLAQRAPDRELPMASTTKIMTALVALEAAEPDEVMTVPPEATEVGESSGSLVAGETLTVRDLLTALLVASGNDAALTLAVGVAGSEEGFVELMNQRAEALGLEHTRFANPHGLDAPGHHASVRDLVTIAQEAMKDPVFREIVAQRQASIPGPGGRGTRTYESENLLLDLDPEADGVKTGMTDDAGFSLVAHSRREGLGGVALYAAIIGSPSSDRRALDADALLTYGFRQYGRATLIGRDEVVGRVPVDDKPGTEIPYRAERPLVAALRLDGAPVTETIEAPVELSGPVTAGQEVGTITVRQGDRVLGRRALIATSGASAPSVWDRFRAGIGSLL
ncbi:MAG: D-alanyl-D-alanine carboxypeptidase family protein [Thermoleophilia bacterium]